MQRSVALLFLAVFGLVLAGGSHNHHSEHRHSGDIESHRQGEHLPRPIDFAPQYRQEKEYVYQYDTQIATGLNDQQQNAVQRMRAQLRLTFTSDKTATAQLQQWQAARMNEDLHQSVDKMMSMESVRSIEIPKRHLDMLEKPFEITYEQGQIKEIVFDGQDKTWSENIKRAAVNALQMRMDIEERHSMTYRVNETTIEGECQSVYTLVPEIKCNAIKSNNDPNYLEGKDRGQCVQVTKSINFDLCKTRPDLRYNHYRGEEVMEQHEQRAVEQSTINQVELKKDEGKYITRFARTISQQTVHLTEKTAMMAITIGELQLKGIKKPTQNAAEVSGRKSASSLMYSLEWDEIMEKFMIDGDEEFTQKQQYLVERHVPEVLVNIAKRLAQSFVGNSQNEWSMDSDSAAHQFTNLVKILRHATKEELEKTEERLFQKDEDIPLAQHKSTLERLYIDGLALAGTQPTVQRLMEKIGDKKLADREAALVLQKLARNIPTIGQQTLNSVWQLCQKAKTGTDFQHACVLSWSRMANTMCARVTETEKNKKVGDVWTQDKKEEPRCSESLKSELVNNAKQLYDADNEDSQQRILALKAFGNMAIDSSIQHLEQIINNRELPRLERIVAIDALRQLTTQIPNKIRRVLMTVFVNKKEYPEIRMNAVHQMLRSQPDQPTISQVAMETMRDSNANVRIFVMSELDSLAMKMQKTNPKAAQQMLNVLQMFKRTSPDELEQMRRSGSRFNTVNMGDHLNSFASLYSNDSSLPKELMFQIDAIFREHFVPAYYQIGLHQQDIEQLITKVYERFENRQISDVLVRGKRSTFENLISDPVQAMKQMFNRLKIVARRNSNAQPSLMLYQREKNMDMWFLMVDEKNMPEPIKQLFLDGELDVSALETQGNKQLNSIHANFVFETKVKIPTIFGVPLITTNRLTKISAMHGSISTELQSTGKYISSGRISLKSTPKISMKLVQKLEAFSPLFTAGVQLAHTIDAQIPLQMEASFSGQDGLVVDFKLPEQQQHVYKLIHVTSHPSTLYRQFPQKSRVYIEHEEHTLYMPQLQNSLVNIDKEMYCPFSGLKVEVRGHLHHPDSNEGIYMGENVVEMHAHINEKTAKIIRFQLRAGSKPVNGEEVKVQRVMRVFEQKRDQLFKGNTKPEEVQMLREYMERYSANAHSLHELDVKLMALSSKTDKNPREQIELFGKALCSKDMKVCNKDIHYQMKGHQLTGSPSKDWSAHVQATIARPTITGLHGSMRSEHVLAHVTAEFGADSNKDSLTLCAYGRPSQMQIQQWNEIKNMRSAKRESESDKYSSMEDSEYDQMVMQQLPSRLTPKHFTMMVEYQLSEQSMKRTQPYAQYLALYTKDNIQIGTWLLAGQGSAEEESMSRNHGSLKGDMVYEGGHLHIQFNDIQQSKRIPSWSNPRFLDSNRMDNEHTSNIFGDQQEQSDNDDEGKENNLPSRHSFGQRQALRRFGGESNNAKCVLDSSFNVESFDGKKYRIPMTTCYTVLAKDCGSSESPKFAVLAKKQSESNSALKIKLLVPKKRFELYEKSDGQMVIKMNDVTLKEEEFGANGIHKITETRRPTFVLHCSATGMELRFDGRQVMVSITDDFLNRQCGVCGHYNLDSEDTLRKEDNKLASNMKEFHASYLYRGEDNDDEKCSEKAQKAFEQMKEDDYRKRSSNSEEYSDELVEDMENKNRRMHDENFASLEQDGEMGKKKHSNKGRKHRKNSHKQQQQDYESSSEFDSQYKLTDPVRMTKFMEEQDMICFTIQPQMGCPEGKYPIVEDAWSRTNSGENNESEVEVYCLPRNNQNARKWKKALKHGKHVIDELKTMQQNRHMPVKQAKKCSQQKQTMSGDY